MASSQSPSVLPVAHVTLHAPLMVATEILESPQAMTYPEASRLDFDAPTHSPPELYTLPVSYTHLDVYKRQHPTVGKVVLEES